MTEIKITRRATIDADFNYYEFEAPYDTEKDNGKDIIRDIEKMVAFARTEFGWTKPKPPKKKAKKAAKIIPTKVKELMGEVPESSEDIKIIELQAGDKVNINVRFEKAGEVQAFINKADGSPGRYVKVDVADASGKMKLTLFGEQCDLIKGIKPNAWLKIENAYCKDYKGSLELSIAYGKMEVVYNG